MKEMYMNLNGFGIQPGPYIWKTYKEVYGDVLNIGSALRAVGAKPVSILLQFQEHTITEKLKR